MEEKQMLDLYSNAIGFSTSVFEFVMTFHLTDPETRKNLPLVRVRMSPQHAMAMYLLLKTNIELYEEKFHSIVLPEELMATLTSRETIEEKGDETT